MCCGIFVLASKSRRVSFHSVARILGPTRLFALDYGFSAPNILNAECPDVKEQNTTIRVAS